MTQRITQRITRQITQPTNQPTIWKFLHLDNVVSKSKQYKYLTTETSRIDMHNIPKTLQVIGLQYAKELGLRGGPFLRTHSMKNRLREYINKPSKNGKYIEVLPKEVSELKNLPKLMTYADLQLVEVGLNRQDHICKMAFTTTLQSSKRTVFLCIGTGDGGLKTFYVTPRFKYRTTYQYSGNPFLRTT